MLNLCCFYSLWVFSEGENLDIMNDKVIARVWVGLGLTGVLNNRDG